MKQYLGVPGHVLLAMVGMAALLTACKTLDPGSTPRVTVEGRTGTYTLENGAWTYKPPNGGQETTSQ